MLSVWQTAFSSVHLSKLTKANLAFLFAQEPQGTIALPKLFALRMTGKALQCNETTRDNLYGLKVEGTRNRLVFVHTRRVKETLKLTIVVKWLGHPVVKQWNEPLHRLLLALRTVTRILCVPNSLLAPLRISRQFPRLAKCFISATNGTLGPILRFKCLRRVVPPPVPLAKLLVAKRHLSPGLALGLPILQLTLPTTFSTP